MRLAVLCLVSLSLVAGCSTAKRLVDSSYSNRVLFEGMYFPARLASAREDRLNFSVTVSRVDQSLSGAREAGRYEAAKHCIENYGRSDVDWAKGPDVEDAELQLVNGQLILEGRCDV